MLVLVTRPLRFSQDGIAVCADSTDRLDLPDALARGLIDSGHVVAAPQARSLTPLRATKGAGRRPI
jgi:hypothetical protein